MRWTARAVLMLALLAPSAVAAGPQQNPAVCVHLAHQLVHYDAQKQRAAQLGNEMWVERFEAQIDVLEDELAANCPEQYAANQSAQQLRDLLAFAGRTALSYFTLGAF